MPQDWVGGTQRIVRGRTHYGRKGRRRDLEILLFAKNAGNFADQLIDWSDQLHFFLTIDSTFGQLCCLLFVVLFSMGAVSIRSKGEENCPQSFETVSGDVSIFIKALLHYMKI